ncbi:MAG: SdrD B-like domain-containing protein [bacterium]
MNYLTQSDQVLNQKTRQRIFKLLSILILPAMVFQMSGFGFVLTANAAQAAELTEPVEKPTEVVDQVVTGLKAANPAADLDQCKNGGVGDPPISPCDWVNGNLNEQHAHYVEGDSVPYRMTLTDISVGAPHELIIGFDVKHSGKHALDYLTNNDRIAEVVDPCDGVTPCVPGTAGDIPSPTDLIGSASFANLEVAEGNQQIKIWNGAISSITYVDEGDLTQDNSEAQVSIIFTVTDPTAVISWGGHIASRLDWGYELGGEPKSAGGINGSPYHMRNKDLDGSGGNQDRSLSASAVLPPEPGALMLTKVVDSGSASPDAFTFEINPDPNTEGQVNTTNGTHVFNDLDAGFYTVTELPFPGYELVSTTCDDVEVVAGELAQCEIHNAVEVGDLEIIKYFDNQANGILNTYDDYLSGWHFVVKDATGQVVAEEDTDGNGQIMVNNLLTGDYTITETMQDGWENTTGGLVQQATVVADDTVTVEFGNRRLPAGLHELFNIYGTCSDESGNAVVAAGVGMLDTDTGTINNFNIPGPVTAAYLFWSGRDNSNGPGDPNITFDGHPVVGVESREGWDPIGYYADVTSLVSPGVKNYTIAGLDLDLNDGAGLHVIYQDAALDPAGVTLFGGLDFAYRGTPYNPVGPDTEVYGITFSPAQVDRTAHLILSVGGGDHIHPNRGDNLWIQTGTGAIPGYLVDQPGAIEQISNMLTASDGPEFDTPSTDIVIPANATYLAFQIESEGNDGESLSLLAASFSVPEFCPGKISGYKWNDTNGNGNWDISESALSGWTINLWNDRAGQPGIIIDTDVTDANGYYEFADLLPGAYWVNEVLQAGWIQTSLPVTYGPLVITLNENYTRNDFGNFELGEIHGTKFEDITANGPSGDDTTIPGITINLYKNGQLYDTDVTDGSGNFSFVDLGPGNYTFDEVLPPGWYMTYSPGLIVMTSGLVSQDNDFGNFQLGEIHGTKYDDKTANGPSGDDTPVSGIMIKLWKDGQFYAEMLTNASGDYWFTDLPAGTYTMTEILPGGWVQTYNPGPVNMTSGLISTGNDFGNFKPIEIHGYKWNDLNGDGVWDNNEPGLSGWTINLHEDNNGQPGAIIDTMVTIAGGEYWFMNLPAGINWVSEVGQAGWTQTSLPVVHGPLDLTSGEIERNLNFGNFELGEIHGYKWNDTNGDGIWGPGEFGLENWTIYLHEDNNGQMGSILDSTTTDINGAYSFINLGPGAYWLSEDTKTGWVQTSVPENIGPIQMTSGLISNGNNFGNFKLGEIHGYKWEDTNGDGYWDPGEFGLENWTINLCDDVQCNSVIDTTTTDSSGYYEFTGLEAGDYWISEEVQPGWTQTSLPVVFGPITMISGLNTGDYNFGNFQDVTIKAYKFNDVDGDGVKDPEDLPIEDWKMYLDGGQMQETDVNGMVSWTVATGGDYEVSEEDVAGWTHTTQNPVTVTVQSGDQDKVVEFLNFKNIDITVNKLIDADGDINTTGDQTVKPGWTVQLWQNGVQIGTDQLTDVNGQYTWTNLGPGTYTVKEIFDANEYTALTATEFEVVVSAGQNETATFINFAPVPLLQIEKTVAVTTLVNPGNTVTYIVVVKNIGNTTAINVVVDDILPTGLVFAETGLQTGQFPIGNLEPDQSKTITYNVIVGSNVLSGVYDNIAKASSDNTKSVEDDAEIQVKIPEVLGVEGEPILTLTKAVNKEWTNPGDTLVYTIVISNTGTAMAENVRLVDVLPEGLIYADTGLKERVWTLGDMDMNTSHTLTYEVLVGKDVKAGDYINVVTATSDNHDSLQAEAKVLVKIPQVLGAALANTGSGLKDLAIAFAAIMFMMIGLVVLYENRKTELPLR